MMPTTIFTQALEDQAKADVARLPKPTLELRLSQLQRKPAQDYDDRDRAVLGLLQAELAKR